MIFDYEQEVRWLSSHILVVVGIVLVAIIVEYIGEITIKALIRKLVHGRHVIRSNQPLLDVKKRQDTIISVSVIVWKIIVLLGAGLAIFTTLFPQVNLLPLLASAGVLGAVIGFGAQSMIKDFIAGSFIIIENQFRVGDDVEIDGATGRVEHITLRSTVIRDDAGNVHYIANGTLFHVINKSMDFSKIFFVLSVQPDTDVDKLVDLVKKVGEKLAADEKWQKKILEPPEVLGLGNFSDEALEVKISGKTQPGEQASVSTEFKKRLLAEIKKTSDIKLSHYQDLTKIIRSK